jgi:hypothetical protein
VTGFVTVWALAACSSAPNPSRSTGPQVLVISLDGFRPDFYGEGLKRVAPHLYQLAEAGASAPEGIEPVFPSLTYPNHATIATGVNSAKHGIYANTIYSPELGLTSEWYFKESMLHAPAIWQVAEDAGKSVAIMRWPVSMGAQVQWLLPEIFTPGDFNPEHDWKLIQENTPAKLLEQISNSGPVKKVASFEDLDRYTAQATKWALRNESPNLTMAHLTWLDLVQHRTGTHSPETRNALAFTDNLVNQILSFVDPTRTTVFILGDHGFADYGRIIHLKKIFDDENLGSQVDIQAEGGQAAIYLRQSLGASASADASSQNNRLAQGKLQARVVAVLQKHAKGLYQILDRHRLKRLGAYPYAFCAVEAPPGTIFDNQGAADKQGAVSNPGATGANDLVEILHTTKGAHGYLPERPEMHAGLIIWGRGVTPGNQLEDVSMLDIAPTVAAELGLHMKTDGMPLVISRPEPSPQPSGQPSP